MKKKVSTPVWVLGLLGLLLLGAIGAAGASGKKTDTTNTASATVTATTTATTTITKAGGSNAIPAAAPVTVTMTATKTEAAPAPTSAAPSGFGDGTYIVGSDIKPGTYKSAGPAAGGIDECYYERDRNTDDPLQKIIDNGNSKGQTVVVVKSGDYSVTFTGCQPFVKS